MPRNDFCAASPQTPHSLPNMSWDDDDDSPARLHSSRQLRNKPRVLLIPKTTYSNAFKAVTDILVSNRIK